MIRRLTSLVQLSRGRANGSRLREAKQFFKSIRLDNLPEVRGLRLLRRWLSAEQFIQFNEYDFFDVRGCHTGRRYRIHHAACQNVELFNELGIVVERLCFVPDGSLVPGDVMLAQKIALETDELAALAVANRFAPTCVPQASPRMIGRTRAPGSHLRQA